MAIIKISDTSQIRVDGVQVRGKNFISVRQWYCTAKDPKFKPTKKGILLPIEKLDKVGKAIKAVRDADEFEELKFDDKD